MRTESLPSGVAVVAMILGSLTALAAHSAAAEFQPQEQQVDKPNHPPGYIAEGPLPDGFPPPGEVGKIVEKSYPLCRTFSAEGNNAFMRCFGYLSQHKHEMTAPVIMDYQPAVAAGVPAASADFDLPDLRRMHFVLGKPSLDTPKREGEVTVGDISQMRVLSLAFQGPRSAAKLKAAKAKLEAAIAERKDLVAAGPMRVLGYNSPMVPRDKSFWEVQIPIKNSNADAAK